jgi:hypothetical protein
VYFEYHFCGFAVSKIGFQPLYRAIGIGEYLRGVNRGDSFDPEVGQESTHGILGNTSGPL